MRVEKEKLQFIKKCVQKNIGRAAVYLFGSRTDNNKKGGDLDILVIGARKLKLPEKIDIRVRFYKKFGEQKLDIVSFHKDEDSVFKSLALDSAIKI